MNILIVGCGKVGSRLAWLFAQDGHDVSVVDADEKKLAALGVDFPGYTTCGIPIDQDVLRRAGIESCEALAAVCAEDNVNIMVAQIAKEIFGIQNVLARVYDPQREEIYSEFGLQTFCPTNLMAASARGILIEQEKPKTLQIGTHTMHFYEVAAPRQVYDCDVSLVELEKDHSLFALRRKNGALELCDGRKLTIRKGDQLVICVVAD